MKTQKLFNRFIQRLLLLIGFSCISVLIAVPIVYSIIQGNYPGAFEDKNDFYATYANLPDLYVNNFGEYCREYGVKPEWIVPNTYRYFDGELYLLYNVPENEISTNFELILHGFLGLGGSSFELNDQVRFYETGWVNFRDMQDSSCGFRIKDIKTYKRFL